MDINELYENISKKEIYKIGDCVKIRSGLFREEDLIPIFNGGNELYFRIDKKGILEILNCIISKCSTLSNQNDYQYMIDLFNLVQNEISNYFGLQLCSENERLSFYMQYGTKINDDDRVCNLSSLKDKNIAKCAEIASVANNILLMLYQLNLFGYKVNYVNSNVLIGNDYYGGHAYLEFTRVNSKGEKTHLIYDVTNPEVITVSGQDAKYPAIYSLKEEEFNAFMKGQSFDNSHFIVYEYYKPKEKREYSGFSMEENYGVELIDSEMNNQYDEVDGIKK